MRALAITLILTVTGCVMPGDIEALQASQSRYADSVNASLEDLRENRITEDQAKDAIEDAQRDYDREVGEKVRQIEQRTDQALAVLKGIQDGSVSWGEGAAGLAGAAGALFLAINGYRNGTRKRDLEAATKG